TTSPADAAGSRPRTAPTGETRSSSRRRNEPSLKLLAGIGRRWPDSLGASEWGVRSLSRSGRRTEMAAQPPSILLTRSHNEGCAALAGIGFAGGVTDGCSPLGCSDARGGSEVPPPGCTLSSSLILAPSIRGSHEHTPSRLRCPGGLK